MEKKEIELDDGWISIYRKLLDSKIFEDKPDKYLKIWIYILLSVNHKTIKNKNGYKRGEKFFKSEWIQDKCKATPDQVKKCLKWLRDNSQIGTERSTRGMIIKVLKFDEYQEVKKNTAPTTALEKHQRSTREAPRYNKNDKNEKNDKKDTNKEFDIFYKAYPKKIAKQNALKSFNRLKVNSTLLEKILADIERRKKSEAWKNKQYIQYPATYLNQQRWEDEYIEPEPEKKPYFRGEPMVKKFGKWKVISEGTWKEFVGLEKEIEWK